MALFRDDAGKTEKPTPQRLTEARDKGQAPLSREFVMAGTLLVTVLAVQHGGFWLIEAFRSILRHGMNVELGEHHVGDGEVAGLLLELRRPMAAVLPPFLVLLGLVLLATCVFGYGQIGFKVSKKAVGFKPEKLNPAANLGKLLSLSSVARTVLSFLKLAVLASVLWTVLHTEWGVLAILQEVELEQSMAEIADMAFTVFTWIALIVLLLSIGDIAWQRHEHVKNLMMTKHEVQDERKRTEGDPQIKSRIRSAQLEIMRQRMMEAVPEADVVITNPEHFAVALRYDRLKNEAPEVLAKGRGDVAQRIRDLAREHDVPVMEDPPLARALFRAVKVGREIPERFFVAVAAVLSHVYRMQGRVA